MAYRFRHDRTLKNLVQWMVSEGTGGNMQTSDIGKLVTLSSNKVGLLQGTSLAPTIPIRGILHGFANGATGSSANSTELVYVAPISPGEILEMDCSTAWCDSTVNMVVTTNIGMYFNNCSSNGIAGGGSSVAGNGNLGAYLNISTAAKVADTSHWLRLVDASEYTSRKVALVQIPTSHIV